jgi:hypothetical protein
MPETKFTSEYGNTSAFGENTKIVTAATKRTYVLLRRSRARRTNNGAAASKPNLYVNLGAEWWSVFGELVEHRKMVLTADEKLVAQVTSRRKLYDSKGREKLESKGDMRARRLESPDRADALIGAAMLGIGARGNGAIGERELAGIFFGGGVTFFDNEPLIFE